MKKLSIEIADTPSRRAMGLMHRKKLAQDAGMLFKFSYPDHLRFWMSSTYIPLDIAFLNDDGTIFQISEMYPLSTRLTSSERPCKYAVEVNQGWFAQNDIGVGDKIGGLQLANKQKRMAQMTPMPEEAYGVDNPQQGTEQDPSQQPNPRVELTLDDHAKVRDAEQHNYAMQIVYQSKGSGQTLPPRKIVPVPGEGYPIGVSEGGEYFTALDSSPTINGGEWQILGNQIKRFLFSNIIALEILDFVE